MVTLTWIAAAAAVVATGVAVVWFLRFRHNTIQASYYKGEYLSLANKLARNPEIDEKIGRVLVGFVDLISDRALADRTYHAMQQDFPAVDQPDAIWQSLETVSPETRHDFNKAIVIFLVGLSYSSWAHGMTMRRLINQKLTARPEHDLQVVNHLVPVDRDAAVGAPLQPA